MNSEVVKIPSERIRALFGPKSTTKEYIEEKCGVKLEIDSEGDVEIFGESTQIFFAKDVVKAIGRGFEPNVAIKLIGDFNLYIISLKEIVESENAITRLRGRVIGEKGKIKIEIESATDSFLSIYGNTIGIISKIDTMPFAKEAIEMLLNGAPHLAVLNYLAKSRREIMDSRLRNQ